MSELADFTQNIRIFGFFLYCIFSKSVELNQKFTLIKKTVKSDHSASKLKTQFHGFFAKKLWEWNFEISTLCVGCISWRQTRGCDGKNGRRHPRYDRGCDEYIRAGRSGFCECESGPTAYKNCNASPFRTCTDACNAGSG